MKPRRVQLPLRGVADATSFTDQPELFAPPGSMRNVRPTDVVEERGRIGTRPGWKKRFRQMLGGGRPVQAVGSYSRAEKITGYSLRNPASVLDGDEVDGVLATVAGNVFKLNSPMGVERQVSLTYSPGGTDYGVATCCYIPGLDMIAVIVNGRVALSPGYEMYLLSASTLATINSFVATNRLANRVTYGTDGTNHFVFVAGLTERPGGSGATVDAYQIGTGGSVAADFSSYSMSGWGKEAVEARYKLIGTSHYLFVLFRGVGAATTFDATVGNTSGKDLELKSGPSGAAASDVRAGVMKFVIGAYSGTRQVQYGRNLDPSDPFFEGAVVGGSTLRHGYLRFSEADSRRTVATAAADCVARGLLPTGFVVNDDGGVTVTHADATYDAFTAAFAVADAGIGFVVTRFSAAGQQMWTTQLPSLNADRDGDGFYNDRPTPGTGEATTAFAIDRDAEGCFYVGGIVPAVGATNCYKLTTGGAVVWDIRLGDDVAGGDSISQTGIFVDPTDGNPIFVGNVSSAWSGGGATEAHIWKRSSVDGASLRYLALDSTADAVSVCAVNGDIFVATELI